MPVYSAWATSFIKIPKPEAAHING